ncbi:MAG: hypothetical protein ACJ766_16045 [Thermoleophilaceae bacterium]
MIGFIRRHGLALLALFVALGGSSYAALRINGSQIEDRTISGKKLKRNTLGGVTIKESRLARVRRARRADRLGKFSASDLRVHCPRGTTPVSGVCAEVATRGPAAYGLARIECDAANRRLPTYEELANLVSGAEFSLGTGGELTSSVYVDRGQLKTIVVATEGGLVTSVPDTAADARRFRCVAYPSN